MNTCTNTVLSERLRVFISSAQDNENEFVWLAVRKRIKERLAQCACLNPFIIEDEPSITPSNQYIQYQVGRSDIVVLLVKGEVRKGTLEEYSLAVQRKKPLLVYFISDENSDTNVKSLKQDIIDNDYCTFHPITNPESIEEEVWKDVMNNLVREFKMKYFNTLPGQVNSIETFAYERATCVSKGIPNKTEIAWFKSCYNVLLEQMDLNLFKENVEKSDCHEYGTKLISWLLYGEWELNAVEINSFVRKCSEVFAGTSWLKRRWNAIQYYMCGNLQKAFSEEESALQIARETNESEWVISDILIDCRNFEIEIHNQEKRYTAKSNYQEELTNLKSFVYLPAVDRYLTNIYEAIEKEEFREKTASIYTETIGSNLPQVLTDLANYLFAAAIYGSWTHIQRSRAVLASLLDHFYIITDDASLAFAAMRQYVLLGSVRELKSYLVSTWDVQYAFITSHADEVWGLASKVPVSYKQQLTKLTLLSSIGLYLSDEVFLEAEKLICDSSATIHWNDSERYFEAILNNLHRFNATRIIIALTPIIAAKRYSVASKLTRIIRYIHLDTVGDEDLTKLAKALRDTLPHMIRVNGDPLMIASLVKRSREIFGDLESTEGNGLVGLQELIYKAIMGSNDWTDMLQENIRAARSQFVQNSQKGVFHGFLFDPYSMISAIIRHDLGDMAIDDIIIHDFIPLSIDVLNSEAAFETKNDCVACLCEVLSYLNGKNIQLSETIRSALRYVDVDKGEDFFVFSNRKAYSIRVMMAKILAGVAEISSLYQWCMEFGELEIRDKIVIVDCLEKYLFHKREETGRIDSLLLSIILQCSSEKHEEIRRIAVKCLSYIVAGVQFEAASIALNRALYDPSAKVRIELLDACKSGILPTEDAARYIRLLQKDANYIIRSRAI